MEVQVHYNNLAELIANLNPSKILELKASDSESKRLVELISKDKANIITQKEKDELDHYLVMERLVRIAKAHARIIIAGL